MDPFPTAKLRQRLMPRLLHILKSLLTKKKTHPAQAFHNKHLQGTPGTYPQISHIPPNNEGWTLYLRGDFSVQVVCCRGGFFFGSFWCSKCSKTSPWQDYVGIPSNVAGDDQPTATFCPSAVQLHQGWQRFSWRSRGGNFKQWKENGWSYESIHVQPLLWNTNRLLQL